MENIKIGMAPTRRSIFSAPDAVKYRKLTADKLARMGISFVDITDINEEGLLYDEADRIKIIEKFKKEKKFILENPLPFLFNKEYFQSLPHETDTDGFFIAKMKKI